VTTYALLFFAAAIGGALNSVAGGGSFVAFPALVFSGVAPIAANATNCVALWPASVASALAYRRELPRAPALLLVTSLASLVGGVGGALLLVRTRDATFVALVPWLLLVATSLFAAGPWLTARLRVAPGSRQGLAVVGAIQLLVAVYGGYFGGGIGILMLASLSLVGMRDIHAMNALKTVLASVINGVAVAVFVATGSVEWRPDAFMIAGGALGGWLGARLARRVDPRRVRAFVLLVACAMTAWFFVRR